MLLILQDQRPGMDLRKQARAHTHLRVAYRSSFQKNSSYIHTLTNDISESGLNLNLDSEHCHEKNLDLILYPATDRPALECQARIVWSEPKNSDQEMLFRQSGLEFVNPTKESRNQLRELTQLALKESKQEINLLEKLSLLNENLNSRKNFIEASQQLTTELFGVGPVRLLLPEKRITTKEALALWSKNLEITDRNLHIPILAKGALVGHLEVQEQKISSSKLNQLKQWAGCLSAFCCSFLCGES